MTTCTAGAYGSDWQTGGQSLPKNMYKFDLLGLMPTRTQLWTICTRLFWVMSTLLSIVRINVKGKYSLTMRDRSHNPTMHILILMENVEAQMHRFQRNTARYITYSMCLFLWIGACRTALCEWKKDCQCWILLPYCTEKVFKPVLCTYWPASSGWMWFCFVSAGQLSAVYKGFDLYLTNNYKGYCHSGAIC